LLNECTKIHASRKTKILLRSRIKDMRSSSNSRLKLLAIELEVEKEIEIKRESLETRFEKIFGVKYDSDPEQLKRAAWILSRRDILEWVDDAGITYVTKLYEELHDAGHDIAKSTLKHYIDACVRAGLLDDYKWIPKSNLYKYTRFIISPRTSREEVISYVMEYAIPDEDYYLKSRGKNADKKDAHNRITHARIDLLNSKLIDLEDHRNKCFNGCNDLRRTHCPQYLTLMAANNKIMNDIEKQKLKLK
jgi:hypothetical protein